MAQKCETHSKQHRSVNLTLWALMLFGLGFMVWHVWVYGPSTHHHGEDGAAKEVEVVAEKHSEKESFPVILAEEAYNLTFSEHGLVGEVGDTWFYFFIGLIIAAYIRTYKLHIRLRKTLNKYKFTGIFVGALVGVFSPLCACGILTTAMSLLVAGLPLAPVMALLISSPLMSPTAFILTISDLGYEWALIRTLAAFIMGVMAGVITYALRSKFETEGIFVDRSMLEVDFHDDDVADERLRCTCRQKFSNRMAVKVKGDKFLTFWAKNLEMVWMIGKYVLVGILVGAVVENYIPTDWLNELFGQQSRFAIVWVTLGSVPLFLHQISASSILYHISEALPGTMNKGAALAFLIGGPVTAIPAMTLLWAMFKKRVFVLYMAVSLLGTILLAYTFEAFVFVPNTDTGSPLFAGVGSVSGGSAAVITKSDPYVRVAADPGNKPVIATYQDLEGGSGIAFDSSLDRFTNAAYQVEGNRKYVGNISHWLAQNSFGSFGKNILIYDTYHTEGYKLDQFQETVRLLTGLGYKVTITDRVQTPELTPEVLQQHGQLWLINGEAKGATFNTDELQAIADFRDGGNGMLIVAGPQTGPEQDYTRDANQVSKAYGVSFAGKTDQPSTLPISILGQFSEGMAHQMAQFFKAMGETRN